MSALCTHKSISMNILSSPCEVRWVRQLFKCGSIIFLCSVSAGSNEITRMGMEWHKLPLWCSVGHMRNNFYLNENGSPLHRLAWRRRSVRKDVKYGSCFVTPATGDDGGDRK